MNLATAVLLGAVEGLTEFLPISSTGHLTILERLLGFSTDDPDVTAFTAIIQVGAVLATLIYFRDDFRRIVFALVRGAFRPGWRADPDWRFGWAVVLGSVPIGDRRAGVQGPDRDHAAQPVVRRLGAGAVEHPDALRGPDRDPEAARGGRDLEGHADHRD